MIKAFFGVNLTDTVGYIAQLDAWYFTLTGHDPIEKQSLSKSREISYSNLKKYEVLPHPKESTANSEDKEN